MKKVIVSRCLMGHLCRFDARRIEHTLPDNLRDFEIYPVCPEIEGGLPCPRKKAEITRGDGYHVLDGLAQVKDDTGSDVTANFLKGAQSVLNLALTKNINMAYLKEKSPSCGVNIIYIGAALTRGVGVTTALLRRHGLDVMAAE
jgi:uncharacterized protein YbbK (DUF523 family)